MSQVHDPGADVCPTGAELRSFLAGASPSSEHDRDALAGHLSGCRRCMEKMEAITFASRVLGALKKVSRADGPSESELTEVANQIQVMSRDSFGSATVPWGREALLPLEPPSTLGHYRVVELLSGGGMGVVYRAEDTTLRRFVALKLLRPAVARDEGFRERFLKEAQTLAAIKHDNVVVVHQVGAATTPDGESAPYLAMELLEGESLKDWMAENPRPPVEWIVRIGRQAAAGLAAAHARNFIHRDVKPGNLWLEAPAGWAAEPPDGRPPLGAVGRIKLLDFGLARPLDEGGSRGVSGTPAYMAPEQARGDRADARSDLFGLGCVLYELCAGVMPFAGRRYPWVGKAGAGPRPLSELNPQTPPALASLIERMLQPDPAARPVSARKVEEELAALEAVVNKRKDNAEGARPARKSSPLALVGAALALAVAIFVLTRSVRKDQPVPQSADVSLPDDPWAKQLEAVGPKQQFTLVTDKLCELNPGLKRTDVAGWIEPELVVRINIKSNIVTDISPVRGLPDVKMVGVTGRLPGTGKFTDLSPLAGMHLSIVRVADQPLFKDLSPLKNDPLRILQVPNTWVESLDDVNGTALEELDISHTQIRDLSPLANFPNLIDLDCTGSPIESFEPLAGTAIQELKADIRTEKDRAVLKRMPHLKRVNDRPVAEFLSAP